MRLPPATLIHRLPLLIAGVAGLLCLTLIAEGVIVVSQGAPTPDGYRIGVATSLPFIAWLFYGAYELARGDIPESRYGRIGQWCVSGLVGFTVLITGIAAVAAPLTLIGVVGTMRWGASVGLGITLGIGIYDARALERTFEAGQARAEQVETERERDRLDEFASIVSHDLRNPHQVAVGRLDLAREDCDSEHLEAVERALDRMDTIISDTLTLARHGQSVGETEPVELGGIVEECWGVIQTGEGRLELEGEGRLLADPDRLRHVFENLIRNAMEHGGADVTVRIGRLEDGSGFYVEDDGPGIPADQRETMFEVGESSRMEGSGFGLLIVNRMVEAHGWQVRATEGSDGGARFEITGVEWLGP